MPFKPPLTTEYLKEVAERNKVIKDPTINALLWEISRLLRYPRQMDALQGGLSVGGGAKMILDSIREDLDKEPSVIEWRASKREMLRR